MQHYGDPEKQPLDQEDLMGRIREMEQLAKMIEPQLDLEQKHPDFSGWIISGSHAGDSRRHEADLAKKCLT